MPWQQGTPRLTTASPSPMLQAHCCQISFCKPSFCVEAYEGQQIPMVPTHCRARRCFPTAPTPGAVPLMEEFSFLLTEHRAQSKKPQRNTCERTPLHDYFFLQNEAWGGLQVGLHVTTCSTGGGGGGEKGDNPPPCFWGPEWVGVLRVCPLSLGTMGDKPTQWDTEEERCSWRRSGC